MTVNEVLALTPKQAFILLISWQRDRSDIIETAGKLLASMFGHKWKPKKQERFTVEKAEPLPKTPNLDRMTQGHIEKLREMKAKREAQQHG
jgi:hypothetical protein